MPIKVNDFQALLLAATMVQSVCTTVNAGEEAATIYRSRYMLAGFRVMYFLQQRIETPKVM